MRNKGIPIIISVLIANFFLVQMVLSEIPQENPEYPGAIWVGADDGNFSYSTERQITKIIIHATGSTYGETKNSFQNPREEKSAHYVIDQDGKIYQFVLERDKAWHARDYNPTTIGIELVSGHSESPTKPSYLIDPNWATPEIYQVAAKLVRYLCQKYNISMDRKYIKGHDEIDSPRKVDPGKYWDWTRFMKLLKGGAYDQTSFFELIIIDTAWALEITVALDPNYKTVSPEGDVLPGQRLTYKVEYENEGEGIAYAVYFTDTLDTDLDDATLEIGPVIDITTGQQISQPGSYNPQTRTITWFVGEVASKQGGFTEFSVNVKNDAQNNSEVINFATVYFPSVPEATRTNGTVNRVTTFIDNIPPITTASILPLPNQAGWNKIDVTVTFTAQDNEGGTGIAKTEYSFDSTNWITYTSSFTITDEGLTTVYYKSTDNAGNAEQAKSLEIKIDKTAPTIIATTLPQPNPFNWNNTDVTVSFIASDTLSGIASVTEPITITTEGKDQYIGGEATDLADNKATTYVIINLDKTPPDITITLNPIRRSEEDDDDKDDEEGNWYELIYSATDNLSGLKSLTAGLVIPSLADYKIEFEQDDDLDIRIDEKKKELKIETPNPQQLLTQLQSGLLTLNTNQILQLKIKQGDAKWKIKEKEKGIKIQAPSIIFRTTASDYADNTLIKDLEFVKQKDDD